MIKTTHRLLATTTIALLLFVSTGSFAQKCKYEKNETDALTNVLVKRTLPEQIIRINGQPIYIKAQCIGTNKYLKLRYYKSNGFILDEDREISFVLNNNKEVVLFPRKMNNETSAKDKQQSVSSLLIYKLNAEQYSQLKQTPVNTIKFSVMNSLEAYPIKSSKQSKLMYILRCVE